MALTNSRAYKMGKDIGELLAHKYGSLDEIPDGAMQLAILQAQAKFKRESTMDKFKAGIIAAWELHDVK